MKKSVKYTIISAVVCAIVIVAIVVPVVLLTSGSSDNSLPTATSILPTTTTSKLRTTASTLGTTPIPKPCKRYSYNHSGPISISGYYTNQNSGICLTLYGEANTTIDLAFGYINIESSVIFAVYEVETEGKLLFKGDSSMNGAISPYIHSSKNSMFITVNSTDTSDSYVNVRINARFLSVPNKSDPIIPNDCGGYIYESGKFCLPQNESTDCIWYVESSQVIVIDSDILQLNDDEFVAIFNGWSINENNLLKNLTGNQSLTDQWFKNSTTIQYHRSSTSSRQSANETRVCFTITGNSNRHLMEAPVGGFSNDDFPDCHPYSEDWLLRVNETKKILLSIPYFRHSSMFGITVYDGPSTDSPVLAFAYGNAAVPAMMSSGNTLRVVYRYVSSRKMSGNTPREVTYDCGIIAGYRSV